MTLRLKRQCALLLALFYMTFAGGLEFLHHHTEGVFAGTTGVSASAHAKLAKATGPAVGKKPFTKNKAPFTECIACQMAQNGHATTPSVIIPEIAPAAEPTYILVSSSFIPVALDTPSSRGPPHA